MQLLAMELSFNNFPTRFQHLFGGNPLQAFILALKALNQAATFAIDFGAEDVMAFAGRAIRAMREESSPHGFNLGMNLGQVAGAGIADHVHLHLVPRWGGDTNFMPVVGHTKVLPELLGETYQRLRRHFASP